MNKVFHCVRLTVAGLMLFSGLMHTSNSFLLLQAIVGYDLVPFELAIWLATLLPLLQVTIGVMLLTETWTHIGFLLSTILLTFFWIAGVTALFRGLGITCGCFGVLSPRLTWSHSALMLLLTMMSAVAYRGSIMNDERNKIGRGLSCQE